MPDTDHPLSQQLLGVTLAVCVLVTFVRSWLNVRRKFSTKPLSVAVKCEAMRQTLPAQQATFRTASKFAILSEPSGSSSAAHIAREVSLRRASSIVRLGNRQAPSISGLPAPALSALLEDSSDNLGPSHSNYAVVLQDNINSTSRTMNDVVAQQWVSDVNSLAAEYGASSQKLMQSSLQLSPLTP